MHSLGDLDLHELETGKKLRTLLGLSKSVAPPQLSGRHLMKDGNVPWSPSDYNA